MVTDAERDGVVAALEQATISFEAAERARDADKLLSHFEDEPGFHLYSDGQRASYKEMADAVREAFPRLRSIEGGFEDVRIMVLSGEYALVSCRLRETITDVRGGVARHQGAASWLWRKTPNGWRIAYGQVDHYPDTGA
jgi:ketosteroid isomerase-like protein